jgi:hypothetical protein
MFHPRLEVAEPKFAKLDLPDELACPGWIACTLIPSIRLVDLLRGVSLALHFFVYQVRGKIHCKGHQKNKEQQCDKNGLGTGPAFTVEDLPEDPYTETSNPCQEDEAGYDKIYIRHCFSRFSMHKLDIIHINSLETSVASHNSRRVRLGALKRPSRIVLIDQHHPNN